MREGLSSAFVGMLLVVTLGGCDAGWLGGFTGAEGRALRVATDWPESDRRRIERGFDDWIRAKGTGAGTGAPSSAVVWASRSDREGPPDVFLGGSIAWFADLDAKDRLERLGVDPAQPSWITARRSMVGPSGGSIDDGRRTAFADPRVDPMTLAWSLGRLRREGWPAAYARLLVLYGRSTTIGWCEGSPAAAIQRGEADAALTRLPESEQAGADVVVFEEGAAIRRGTRRSASARAFLQFLEENTGTGSDSGPPGPPSIAAEGLAADLLGATLVDAQDELRTALASVREAGLSPESVPRLTQLPPWPPASVEKLSTRGGEGAAALIETLTNELAPGAGSRVWLSQSWLRPHASIDEGLLREIAAVDQGRLAREPRFRAWLRAEWTQWARQRYRWVARLAASRSPLLTSSVSGEP